MHVELEPGTGIACCLYKVQGPSDITNAKPFLFLLSQYYMNYQNEN